MEPFAVIESGGKQYRVSKNDVVTLEKVGAESGSDVFFDKVLLFADGGEVRIGTPYVAGARVAGKILTHGKGEKKIIFRYHSKTRYRKKKGHRQLFTRVKIVEL